jgi:hypothetical protein
MDESRLSEMVKTINDLKKLNRELWDFLPRLQASVVSPQTSQPKG